MGTVSSDLSAAVNLKAVHAEESNLLVFRDGARKPGQNGAVRFPLRILSEEGYVGLPRL